MRDRYLFDIITNFGQNQTTKIANVQTTEASERLKVRSYDSVEQISIYQSTSRNIKFVPWYCTSSKFAIVSFKWLSVEEQLILTVPDHC